MKNILKILIPVIALSLGSCGKRYNDFYKEGEYNGYDVRAWTIAERPYIAIGLTYGEPSITANSKNDFPRFDEIHLWDVPEGHELEQYASLDSLQKIYEYIREHGKSFSTKQSSNH